MAMSAEGVRDNSHTRSPSSTGARGERTPLLQDRNHGSGTQSSSDRAETIQQQRSRRKSLRGACWSILVGPARNRRRAKSRSLACRVAIGLSLAAAFLLVVAIVLLLVLARSATSGILLHLFSSLGGLSTCSECYLILGGIRQLALLGDKTFTNTFTTICIDLRIQPADVCRGALSRQGPVIAQSLRHIQPNRYTAAAFCSKMFGLCDSHIGRSQDWPDSVFPPANITAHPNKRSGKTKKLVQIADIHVDRAYLPGAEARCGRALCCRDPPEVGGLLGTPKIVSPAGEYGHPLCDTPFSLFDSLLEAVQEVAGDAVAVISTGDVPSHAVWEESQESVSRDILDVYSLMRSRLAMPVYGAIGNHDVSPVNLFPPAWNRNVYRSGEWIYDLHYLAWEGWIGRSTSKTAFIERDGCYSTSLPSLNIRIISLNTNFWSADNFYLYDSENLPQDPQGILAFLITELHAAESAGQRAYIVGHASPSVSLPGQSHYLDQIMQRYHRTIVGQFYGHTHHSEISIGYSSIAHKMSRSATTVAYTAGSVTPFGGTVNPTFRVYDIDDASGEIWDWTDYVANISDPAFQESPRWRALYSVREEFSAATQHPRTEPLTPAFWHVFSETLAHSQQLFRRYVTLRYGGSRFGAWRACRTESCWNYSICALRRSRREEKCDGSYARNATSQRLVSLADKLAEVYDRGFGEGMNGNRRKAFGFEDVLVALRSRLAGGEDLRHLAL